MEAAIHENVSNMINFAQRIWEGLHLIVLRDRALVNALTSWNTVDSRMFIQRINRTLTGGGFASGPGDVLYVDWAHGRCTEVSSLPNGVDGMYSTNGHAAAWTALYGRGRVTYLSSDWGSGYSWPMLLEASLGWCPGSLQVSPLYDSPFGGAVLTLNTTRSSLVDANSSVTVSAACVFFMQNYQQTVPGAVVADNSVECLVPPAGQIGRATVGLSLDAGNSTIVNTSFYFVDNIPPEIVVKVGEMELLSAPIVLDAGPETDRIINITWVPQASHND
eukprot:5136229-Amphidinium_carterae.1